MSWYWVFVRSIGSIFVMSTGQTQIYHELDMPKFTLPTVLISPDPQYLFSILISLSQPAGIQIPSTMVDWNHIIESFWIKPYAQIPETEHPLTFPTSTMPREKNDLNIINHKKLSVSLTSLLKMSWVLCCSFCSSFVLPITKTRPYNIQRLFAAEKNDNFQLLFFYFFHIFAQNIDRGYTLEPPQCNEYPQSMF